MRNNVDYRKRRCGVAAAECRAPAKSVIGLRLESRPLSRLNGIVGALRRKCSSGHSHRNREKTWAQDGGMGEVNVAQKSRPLQRRKRLPSRCGGGEMWQTAQGKAGRSANMKSRLGLTVISAYGCSAKAESCVCSSSAAAMGTASCDPRRNVSCWLPAGIPVIGSRRDLSTAMLHDGLMRRSDDEFGELMSNGTSAAAWRDMLAAEVQVRLLKQRRRDRGSKKDKWEMPRSGRSGRSGRQSK